MRDNYYSTLELQFRQGDIFFEQVKELPLTALRTGPVIAEGEKTGHKHQVTGQLQVYRDPEVKPEGPKQPVYIVGTGKLIHDQHGAIDLPEAVYQLRRQREYVAGTRTIREAIKERIVRD